MRNWIIGAIIVIGGALVGYTLYACGIPKGVACIVSVAVSTIGFCMQIRAAFKLKCDCERELRQAMEEHRQTMEKARTLPPEQAIELLLRRAR